MTRPARPPVRARPDPGAPHGHGHGHGTRTARPHAPLPDLEGSRPVSTPPAPPSPAPSGPHADHPLHEARDLTGGGPQAWIRLDGTVYTLRITRAGKLILTK